MELNPENALDEIFQTFDYGTRRELIELRQYLATEEVAAWTANDAVQAAVIEALFARIDTLLERIEQREVRTATRAAEFSGVN